MARVERALTFLATQDRPVELAWARCTTGSGSVDEVVAALERYQNPDGGFGRNLELDIHAPDSQPFAARLAMRVMIDVGVPANHPMAARLEEWLAREQGEDGDWRFSPGVYRHQLAPWFAGWTFPAPNPALCLAGAAKRLGIGSRTMFDRVDALIARLGKPEDAASGEFYAVLPYAEFFAWVDHPERERYLEALVAGVRNGTYDDASHFFEHAGGPDSELAKRLPRELIDRELGRLEGEQADDGGWPSPYDPRWRAWATASALATLRSYGRLTPS